MKHHSIAEAHQDQNIDTRNFNRPPKNMYMYLLELLDEGLHYPMPSPRQVFSLFYFGVPK